VRPHDFASIASLTAILVSIRLAARIGDPIAINRRYRA
jgi:hypothetical protein